MLPNFSIGSLQSLKIKMANRLTNMTLDSSRSSRKLRLYTFLIHAFLIKSVVQKQAVQSRAMRTMFMHQRRSIRNCIAKLQSKTIRFSHEEGWVITICSISKSYLRFQDYFDSDHSTGWSWGQKLIGNNQEGNTNTSEQRVPSRFTLSKATITLD